MRIKSGEEATMAATHKGECFCGAVHVEVSGEPEAMGYCHCRSCRSWSGGPVNAFTLWKPAAVRVTAGAENIATFQKTEVSQRQYCRKCGGHLMTNHPPLGLVDVFPRKLCRNCFVYARRAPQAEGFSQRVWRLRRSRAGVRSMSAFDRDKVDVRCAGERPC
jgi:hypothetical protein